MGLARRRVELVAMSGCHWRLARQCSGPIEATDRLPASGTRQEAIQPTAVYRRIVHDPRFPVPPVSCATRSYTTLDVPFAGATTTVPYGINGTGQIVGLYSQRLRLSRLPRYPRPRARFRGDGRNFRSGRSGLLVASPRADRRLSPPTGPLSRRDPPGRPRDGTRRSAPPDS